nr:Fatty acid hydroxylase superfamily [uncultured bacterium]
MEAYAKALSIAIPFFIFLIGIEAFFSWRMGIKINRGADMISSLSSGLTNIVKDLLGLSIIIVSYTWLVDKVALFYLAPVWYVYVLAFIAKDFAGYWIHRLEHRINIFWNRHIIHHSSEEFNLSCALRQSTSEVFSFVGLFLLPAALLGIPAEVMAVIAPIQLFAQFWYHTRLINKMGFLETFLVTPSHHRVHHAINAEYIDKNYSQIFIVWDKLFGTFQPELKEVPAVFGVKRPVHTWNPLLIAVQHVGLILKDALQTKSWKDKLRIWFMPTGWRPADVMTSRPVDTISDVYAFPKYDTQVSMPLLIWSWTQYWILLGLTMYLFFHLGAIGFPMILVYGLFVFVSIFCLTALLDKATYAGPVELIRFCLGGFLMYRQGGDWFGMSSSYSIAPYFIGGYLVLSLMMTIYFQFSEVRKFQMQA